MITIGNPENPAILFLHGFLGTGEDWNEVAYRLADQHFCILPDLPGHGKSHPGRDPREYSFQATAARLIALLDDLGISEAKLVGYSMGARVALYLALEYPARFAALVLEGANPGLKSNEERKARSEWESGIIERLRGSDIKEFVDYWYDMPLFHSLHRNPERLDQLKAKRIKNKKEGLILSVRGIGLSRQPNLWPRLKEIEMSVLLIAGGLDQKFSVVAKGMAGEVANAKLEVVEKAGHNVHFEDVERFCDLTRDFLRIESLE